MNKNLQQTFKLFIIFFSPLYLCSQTTDIYTTSTTWTVPFGVFSVSIAGGAGGGGRMANMANSGWDGNSTTSSNGTTKF
jgi:hypothetical protein